MKIILNKEYRIVLSSNDPLFLDFDFDVEPPIGDLFEYLYIDNKFVHRPLELEELIPVVILSIPNVELDFHDADNNYTVLDGVEYLATGTCEIPAQLFRVPFVRTDTGRTIYMKAAVAEDGNFTLYLSFPTRGEWYTDTEQLNSGLSNAMFSIDKQVFKVM